METEGALKVWYIPQVPMEAFEVIVPDNDLKTAKLLLNTIIDFSIFEFENKVKPDYSDAGGICRVEDGEWWDVDEEELEAI
jgi:hypothetical protein